MLRQSAAERLGGDGNEDKAKGTFRVFIKPDRTSTQPTLSPNTNYEYELKHRRQSEGDCQGSDWHS